MNGKSGEKMNGELNVKTGGKSVYGKRNLYMAVFWVVLGIVCIVCDVLDVFESEMFAGFGGAWIAVGILQLVKYLRYKKNPKYKEKIDTSYTDERVHYISMKAWSFTGFISIFGLGTACLLLLIVGDESKAALCGYGVCALLIIYTVSYLFLSRRN